MKIGLFSDTYTPDINGVVSSIVTLQKLLEDHGNEVFVITNHKSLLSKEWQGNVLRLPGLELKWLYGYKLSTPYHFSAAEEIRKLNLDVIHVHTEFGVGIFGRVVAKSLDIPLVSTYHTMYEDYTHYINFLDLNELDRFNKKIVSTLSRSVGDSCQAVIAPSVKTKETLLKYKVTTPIYVIPTGLNLKQFDPSNKDVEKTKAIRKAYGLKDSDHVIAYVGRVAQEKSIEIPIEGFKYVSSENVKLLIVGGGPQLQELKDLVASLHLENKVFFTDKKTRDEITDYYFAADAFVSASLSETQGMTFMEAMACELPVFARPDEVLEELVIENESGYYFKTPEEFASKVEAFFKLDEQSRIAMKKNAHSKVGIYDGEVFYAKVMSVYYQAMDDYEEAYTITKIKTVDDCMKITVENDKEDQPIKILISSDDYFEYKIRRDMKLDRMQVEEFKHRELILYAMRSCVRKLRIKDRTRKELKDYMIIQSGLEENDIEGVLNDLEGKGYLNDYAYALNKVELMFDHPQGHNKIVKTLMRKGIDKETIEECFNQQGPRDEESLAVQMATRLQSTIKDKSEKMKKQVIIEKLIHNGFDSSIAKQAVNRLDFSDDEEEELLALDKTISKACRNYQRKYKGRVLRTKVIQYCVLKGFSSESIRSKIDEMEWENDENN
ncbi:MAG: RecX family transcriptional regulator [Erysipelotrichaceae bacterium]